MRQAQMSFTSEKQAFNYQRIKSGVGRVFVGILLAAAAIPMLSCSKGKAKVIATGAGPTIECGDDPNCGGTQASGTGQQAGTTTTPTNNTSTQWGTTSWSGLDGSGSGEFGIGGSGTVQGAKVQVYSWQSGRCSEFSLGTATEAINALIYAAKCRQTDRVTGFPIRLIFLAAIAGYGAVPQQNPAMFPYLRLANGHIEKLPTTYNNEAAVVCTGGQSDGELLHMCTPGCFAPSTMVRDSSGKGEGSDLEQLLSSIPQKRIDASYRSVDEVPIASAETKLNSSSASVNYKSGKVDYWIKDIHENPYQELVTFSMNQMVDGEPVTLKVTPTHPMLLSDGSLISAEQLAAKVAKGGEAKLVRENGSYDKIMSAVTSKEYFTAYNFAVSPKKADGSQVGARVTATGGYLTGDHKIQQLGANQFNRLIFRTQFHGFSDDLLQ